MWESLRRDTEMIQELYNEEVSFTAEKKNNDRNEA